MIVHYIVLFTFLHGYTYIFSDVQGASYTNQFVLDELDRFGK